jgi:hypothetical protein
MTGTDVELVACQLGDCRNRAALTVTVELPTSWTEEREYTTRMLQVAVCGECARELELLGLALLAARVQFATRLDRVQGKAKLLAQLVGLIEAVGPPFEPVQGSVFARWLAELDQPTAQSAWRLLAHVKRRAVERDGPPDVADGSTTAAGRPRPSSDRTPPMETTPFRRPVLVGSREPSPGAPPPPFGRRPRGGDDAA